MGLLAASGVVAAGLLLFVLVARPDLGVTLLILSGLLMPPVIDGLFGRRLNGPVLLMPVLIAVWLLGMARRPRDVTGWSWPGGRPLLLLLALCSLSFVAAQIPQSSQGRAPLYVQAGALAIILFSGAAYFVTSQYCRSTIRLRNLVFAFLLAGGIRVVLNYLPAGTVSRSHDLLPSGELGSMFWTWLFALTFGQIVANQQLGNLSRLALITLLGLSVHLTLFHWRDWASGWLPGLVAICVVMCLVKPRLSVFVIVLGIVLALVGASDLVKSFWTAEQQYSTSSRWAAAAVLLRIAGENLLLGLGPANYYFVTPGYRLWGWYVHFSSHNTYMDLVLQSGIVALLCFVWFMGSLLRLALRLRAKVPDGFTRGYLYGSIGGLVGTLVAGALGDWVLPFAYNVGVAGFRTSVLAWVFLGGLSALSQTVKTGDSCGTA